MGARNQLNKAYAMGSLLLAAFVGLVFNSWAAFGVVAMISLGLNLMGGDIRLGGGRRFGSGHIRMAGSRRR